MALEYKPDWEQAKANLRAWWAGEEFGRCALAVTAPRSGAIETIALRPPTPPESVEARWMDVEYRLALAEWQMERTYYGGEAAPNWNSGYAGWNAIPTYLGCPCTLDETTGWWDPILGSAGGDGPDGPSPLTDFDYRALVIDPVGRSGAPSYWRVAREMLRAAAEASRGRYIVGVGAIGGCGDTLAALRDTMRLLYDVSDCPEYVLEFELYLMRQWTEVYDELYALTSEVTEGSTCWNDIWAPGRYYIAQCDFSYMISPRMFRELFLPALEEQTRFLDYSIYHLDGVAAFAHVPALLELPRLRAIQIVPGAGKPSALHWPEMLKRIQDAGKGLELHLSPEEVEPALELLSARHLFIRTWCETEAKARELVRRAERNGK